MEKHKRNEKKLIQASLQGQTQAFGYLVEEYQSLICAITYGAIGNILSLATGQPIQSFSLRACWQSGRISNFNNHYRWTEINQPEGTFTWDVEKHGIYRVQVVAGGYAPVWSEDINSQSDAPVEISLSPGGTLKGTIVSESGNPMSNAKVIPLSLASGMSQHTLTTFSSDQGAVNTAKDGSFTLTNLPPGLETLKVVYPGHAFSIADNIKIVAGQVTQEKPIVIRPGGTVEGIVYDDKGSLLAGQVMQIRIKSEFVSYSEPPMASATTDSNGFYHFERLPEVPCVIHRAFSSNMLGVIVQNLIPENAKVHVLDFGGTPLVYGSIVTNSQALANHKLRLDTPQAYFKGNFTYFAQTNALGDFTLRGVPAGPHTIYYAHPVQEGQWIELTTIDVGIEDLDLGVINKKE